LALSFPPFQARPPLVNETDSDWEEAYLQAI